jgi:hypothetical protein
MLEWVNNKYQSNLTEEGLQEIRDFTLLWNILENKVFDTHFSISRLQQFIVAKGLQLGAFDELLTYFRNRYCLNGQINERYAYLNFRENDKEPLVRRVLLGGESTDHEKILAIGIVVYRYRNNLFHGEKDFAQLDGQTDNFRNANKFIMILLDS